MQMSLFFLTNPAENRWHSLDPPGCFPRDAPPPPLESVRTAFARSLGRSYADVITKFSRLDGLPIFITHGALLARFACRSSAIKSIINLAFNSASMPSSMKNAVLSPLLKKPSQDFEIFSNVQPVSNLKFLSKVIEKATAIRVTNYLCDNDLNKSLLPAYKKQHSWETAFLRVQNDIRKSIDDKQCVVLLLLDLSAAFDTVDHKVLLHRL